MSLRNQAKIPFRYSKGPLYSELELHYVTEGLERDGYVKAEDNTALGIRTYLKTEDGQRTGCATIYLDSLGCDPLNSGIMFIDDKKKGVRGTTVWEYAQECKRQKSWNPLVHLINRII
jgi:hypothetical protein